MARPAYNSIAQLAEFHVTTHRASLQTPETLHVQLGAVEASTANLEASNE